MNDRVKVFFCDPTGEATYVARAWHREDATCDGEGRRELGRFPLDQRPTFPSGLRLPCAKCGEALAVCSQSQNQVYRRTDTAAEVGGEQPLPAGAIWAGDPAYDYPKGPDGRTLWCKLPDGHTWCIDGRANNCTRPDDNAHRCWVRTGRPEDGTLDVGKGGDTCSAGAGSIATSRYHGFLRNGHLVRC